MRVVSLCGSMDPMATLTKQMRGLIGAEARDAVQRELARVRLAGIPVISAREQRSIEKKYGKPSGRAVRTARIRI